MKLFKRAHYYRMLGIQFWDTPKKEPKTETDRNRRKPKERASAPKQKKQ